MDSLSEIIDKFINWAPRESGNIEHYSHTEFLEILEQAKKNELNMIRTAQGYKVSSEERIHAYAANVLLESLIGKMKYGKRLK